MYIINLVIWYCTAAYGSDSEGHEARIGFAVLRED